MKVYAGAPAAARCYLEADRGRADDYYLTEGTGLARRFTATHGRVTELGPLTGEAYETWVAGRDPESGQSRGRLRSDAHAVRFVEVVVNGPKTWSLAAALHPDIAAAYEAAQDRAAEQIVAWLSEHATTRVGPAGGQVQVPVEMLEAATVRHYTSRANDPHWHLHLQFLSRVYAAAKWRGLHTVGIRDFLGAINGIGHAAMDTDPELNAAFAANGYTKDPTGEIPQLAEYVGAFSARHAQIARNADRYEREWAAAHPGETAGPALRHAWDARAWAEGRPDKVAPQPRADVGERWRTDLAELGFRAPTNPVPLSPTPVGALDRDELVRRALTRLAAVRSAWNAADVRGEVERLIAAEGVVVDAGVRIELAEDLTARAMRACVPLLQRDGVAEHIRAWTSRPVLAVEADLTARFAARAVARSTDAPHSGPIPPPTHLTPTVAPAATAGKLDAGQTAAVAALAGDRALIVIEGAAGAGKTTTLAATRQALEEQGRRLVVVTPTLKAAKVAAAEIGTAAGSVARLTFEYGWRWDDDGAWTRLVVGQTDPVTGKTYAGPEQAARLLPGDLLVVDEAGMLDQDTARALLTIADECQVRAALLGDRHQLAAVGRGGVLHLAVGQVDADAYLTLQGLHRFTRTGPDGRTLPDTAYADLTLAMRAGDDPGKVFDVLLARGQIRLHPDPETLREALAGAAAAPSSTDGERIAVVADTREQVAELNAAIRDRLVAAGRVDDVHAVVTAAGEWIGVGDRIVTRRNDRDLDVANRDTWLVRAVAGSRGGLLVTPADVTPADGARGSVTPAVPPRWQGARVLPADYVAAHVELAYAATAHGAQGETVTAAHLVVGEHTGAASAYVGMTRGRRANTAHLVATDVDQAREQWIAVFARDRADLGPAHAAQRAAAEAARYATPRSLDDVLAELRAAWTEQQRCGDLLTRQQLQREALRATVARHAESSQRLSCLEADCAQAATDAAAARQRAEASGSRVAADADRIRDALLDRWNAEREAVRQAARVVLDGSGRLGPRRGAVARAGEQLTDWHATWASHLPGLPADHAQLIRTAAGNDDRPTLEAALGAAARRAAERADPEYAKLAAAAVAAERTHYTAQRELDRARYDHDHRHGTTSQADYAQQLAEAERGRAGTRQQLTDIRARITTLQADPALLAQPPERLQQESAAWRAGRDAIRRTARTTPQPTAGADPSVRRPHPEDLRYLTPHRTPGQGIGR
ncbi:MobF family relaxase [Blastococcus saxobsidens]|uniref:Conjugative relaxase TrwC n=1 Tax=Blastococcus saxobsidens (strain DD2) TaxID=1146883 RepID=H6RWV6_BLASD|nr:MobF family relaxase [Blastococcus saxobsidens]CCG02168.1 conjugative relaxase TrwC [Blastococcus saxobsidens DD2]